MRTYEKPETEVYDLKLANNCLIGIGEGSTGMQLVYRPWGGKN